MNDDCGHGFTFEDRHLCIECETPGGFTPSPLLQAWETGWKKWKNKQQPIPDFNAPDDYPPITMICGAGGTVMTMWQNGNVVSAWDTVRGRKVSTYYARKFTIELARKLNVAA